MGSQKMALSTCILNTSAAYTYFVNNWSTVVAVILLVNTGFNKYRYSSGIHTKS